jgi:hypothetical protein
MIGWLAPTPQVGDRKQHRDQDVEYDYGCWSNVDIGRTEYDFLDT